MRRRPVDDVGFADFVVDHETRLRQAFTSMWGPELGREAALDALAFGWEYWDRVRSMENPVGYLFVVGRNRVNGQRSRRREFPVADLPLPPDDRSPSYEPALEALIGALSERERQVVMLLHSSAWSMSEVAELLDVSKSSIQTYAERGLDKLRVGLGLSTRSPPRSEPVVDDDAGHHSRSRGSRARRWNPADTDRSDRGAHRARRLGRPRGRDDLARLGGNRCVDGPRCVPGTEPLRDRIAHGILDAGPLGDGDADRRADRTALLAVERWNRVGTQRIVHVRAVTVREHGSGGRDVHEDRGRPLDRRLHRGAGMAVDRHRGVDSGPGSAARRAARSIPR